MNILTANEKMLKSLAVGWRSYGIALRPHMTAGLGNLCPMSSAGCRARCLGVGGLNRLPTTVAAQQMRSELFVNHPEAFSALLAHEIKLLLRRPMRLAVRLNIQSDCVRVPELVRSFQSVQFYDYTKIPEVVRESRPDNYHVVFSHSGTNLDQCKVLIREGWSIAVAFEGELPKSWQGLRVVNGDAHDLTFLHKGQCVIGLGPKQGATHGNSGGFIVRARGKLTERRTR